jgi:hypothetical protein
VTCAVRVIGCSCSGTRGGAAEESGESEMEEEGKEKEEDEGWEGGFWGTQVQGRFGEEGRRGSEEGACGGGGGAV